MKRPALARIAWSLFFLCASTTFAQSPIFTLQGGSANEQFGYALSSIGDIDGDGLADLAVGARQFDTLNNANTGAVFIHSGSSGALISLTTGGAPADRFGASIARLGDLNNDGFEDLAVGAPQPPAPNLFGQVVSIGPGFARVLSGADLTMLYQIPGITIDDRFGEAVAAVGDVDDDGNLDFLVAAPRASYNGNESGRIALFSGFDGALMREIDGLWAGDRLGTAVSAAGDIDDDGIPDFMAGSPLHDPNGLIEAGLLQVFSGFDGSVLYALPGGNAGDQLGASLARLSDLDADGIDDLAVGAPLADPNGLIDAGEVLFVSGASGSVLLRLQGDVANRKFGASLSLAGDINGDSREDLIIGATGGTAASLPYASLVSGKNGDEIVRIPAPTANNGFGAAACSFGEGRIAIGGTLNGPGFVWAYIPVKPTRPPFVGSVSFGGSASPSGQPFLYESLPEHEQTGADPEAGNNLIGSTVAFIGDTNGDGQREYLVGVPNAAIPGHAAAGKVIAYSGDSGAAISSSSGTSTGMQWGMKVASAGDVDGDGVPDHMFSAHSSATAGSDGVVRVIRSSNPFPLVIDKIGDPQSQAFGEAIAAAGDLNADGFGDILVGDELYGTAMPQGIMTGRVYAYSGATGALLYAVAGPSHGCRFGYALAGLGDLDSDGHDDFAVGAPYLPNAQGKLTGGVFVFSGKTGSQLFLWYGTKKNHGAGAAIASTGDLNGDGVNEVLIGLPAGLNMSSSVGLNAFYSGEKGSVQIRSGKTGTVLETLEGQFENDFFGWQVAGGEDFDRDGVSDIVVGAPSPDSTVFESPNRRGEIWVFSGATFQKIVRIEGEANDRLGQSLSVADMDGDGRPEILAGAPKLYDTQSYGRVRVFRVYENPSGFGAGSSDLPPGTVDW